MRASRTALLLLLAGGLVQAQAPSAALRPGAGRTDSLQGRDELAWPPRNPAGLPISDNATLRREAARQWFGEWSPAFRRHLLDQAAVERVRHAHLLPRLAQDPATGNLVPASSLGLAPESGVATLGTTWINLGPTNANTEKNGSITLNARDGGRISSIVFHPSDSNTIYIATSGGGVWKTTTGGASWTPITETLGTLSCGALAMDPTQPNTLYLGLGDAFDGTGVGLVKSTDGGASWSAPVYLGASTQTRDLAVCPGNPSILLATTNMGLFRSGDGGASWSSVNLNTGLAATPGAWDLAWTGGSGWVVTVEADPANASGATDGRTYYSSDNGANWTRSTGFTLSAGLTRASVASAPSNRSILYAMASNASYNLADIFKSTNGGQSWTALGAVSKRYKNGNADARTVNKLFNGQGWYDQAIAIEPGNPSVAYFGGALHMARTSDGGSTWYQASNWLGQYSLPYVHADFHAYAFSPDGLLFAGTDGGLFKRTNASTNTWTSDLNIGVTSHLVYSVGSSLAAPSAVIGGFQDNGTRVRVSDTSTFNQVLGGDGFGSAIHPGSGSTMLGTLYYTAIYKSTNGGTSFASASSGIAEAGNSSTAPFYTRIVPGLADGSGNTVYTASNTKVYRSLNYAGSWSALGTSGLPTTSLYIRNLGAAPSNGNVLGVVANSGRVFLSATGGSVWAQAATLPNHGTYLSSVAFGTGDANTVYVSSVAPDATKTHLWKSTDFGQTWAAIDGGGLPAGIPVNCVVNDPNSAAILYAGTHLGLYKSADGGATWTRHGSGMPLVNVTDLYVSPDGALVRAATFGRGFWELQ